MLEWSFCRRLRRCCASGAAVLARLSGGALSEDRSRSARPRPAPRAAGRRWRCARRACRARRALGRAGARAARRSRGGAGPPAPAWCSSWSSPSGHVTRSSRCAPDEPPPPPKIFSPASADRAHRQLVGARSGRRRRPGSASRWQVSSTPIPQRSQTRRRSSAGRRGSSGRRSASRSGSARALGRERRRLVRAGESGHRWSSRSEHGHLRDRAAWSNAAVSACARRATARLGAR